MKTMSCKQLGGACEKKFHANSFEEMGELSKKHAMEMAEKGDIGHINAMKEMQKLMKDTDKFKDWFNKKLQEFDEQPEDK